MTRRSADRAGPSPAAHAEARMDALSARLQADADAARAVLRELHGAVQEARAAVRGLRHEQAEAQSWGDALRDEAYGAIRQGLDATVEKRTKEINAHFDDGMESVTKQIADLRLQVISCEDPQTARRWIKDALSHPAFIETLAVRMHEFLEQGTSPPSLAASPVKVRAARPGEVPGVYLGNV